MIRSTSAPAARGPSDCGYARSKLLGVCSFFNLSKADAAVLWAAFSHVDPSGSERVSIEAFANAFCPNSREVLQMLWDKYNYSKPLKGFKASVVHVDEDEDADALDLTNEAELQQKSKEQHLKALEEQSRKQAEKNFPTYVQFLCFLLFFASTTDKSLPRWLYWLWFHVPKTKPSVERLLAMASEVWPKKHPEREKYSLAVRKGVRVVDEGFDAASFAIYNSKTGGAFARPALVLKRDLFQTINSTGGLNFWGRVSSGVEKALGDFAASMEKLEDRKLKGTPAEFASKGERKSTRREMRKFLSRYVDFSGMKTNEEAIEGRKGVLLPLIKDLLTRSFHSVVAATNKVDLTGRSDFVRKLQIARKLEAWHARRREELEAERVAAEGGKSTLQHRGGGGGSGSASPTERLVPLEWTYRKQLCWPHETLVGKARTSSERARDLVERVRREVTVIPKVSLLTPLAPGHALVDDDEEEEEEEEEEGGGKEGGNEDDDDDDD